MRRTASERARWARTVEQSPHRVDAVDARSGQHFAPLPPYMLLRQQVAIVVNGPSRAEAPVDDPVWEVWGCNEMRVTDSAGRQRADRWFEMHEEAMADDLAYVEALGLTTYMSPVSRRVPTAVEFPFGTAYPFTGLRYGAGAGAPGYDIRIPWPMLSCSIAYMLALAVALGAERIGLYGAELPFGTARERTVERASVEFWIGVALGRGIGVDLPRDSRLCRRELYGVHYWQEARAAMEEVAAIAYVYKHHDLPSWKTLARSHRQPLGVLGPPSRRKVRRDVVDSSTVAQEGRGA